MLDAYAQQWEQMHTDTCLASAVRHEQSDDLLDRRMLCLDQRLAELDQLVGVFEEADRTTVERAVDASRGLSGLAHCADIEALMAGEEPPPPGAERERLESVDRGIARVRALEAAGRYQEAEEAAEVALAMAREAGSPSREARASMEMAGHYLHLNDGRTAEPLLYRAVELADRARDDHLRARALSSLVDALGRQDQFARARVFSGLARAALERIGSPPTGVASLDRALGVVALEQGRLTEARDHLERALEGVVKEHDETSSAYLNTLNNLAVVQRDLGEYAVALENFEAIRDSWRASYGEDHPGSAIMRMNVGTVLSTLGRQEQAIAEYGKALATFEKAIGPDCLDVGYTSEALAIAVGELGRYEEALGLHDRAQTIFRAHGEAGRTDLALSLDNMGVVYQLRGELERAREIHEESYRLWREVVGDDHPDLGYPLSHLAQDLWAMGDAAGARTKFDRALELFERASVAPDEVAEVRFNLAKTWEGEDDAMARRLAQQARAEYGRAGEGFRERAAEVDDWLSQLGPKTGD